MLLLAALATFVPVTAVADVTNSKGSKYRVETCFLSPDHLATGFEYPDRTETLTIRGGEVKVATTGKAEESGGDAERRFAFGHNFHAIALNAAHWGKRDTLSLPFGGTMTVLERTKGIPSKMRIEIPDTTPIALRFSDWRKGTPYRLELVHAGVTYDYHYRSVVRQCALN